MDKMSIKFDGDGDDFVPGYYIGVSYLNGQDQPPRPDNRILHFEDINSIEKNVRERVKAGEGGLGWAIYANDHVNFNAKIQYEDEDCGGDIHVYFARDHIYYTLVKSIDGPIEARRKEALAILDGMIDGKSDDLAKLLKYVREVLTEGLH